MTSLEVLTDQNLLPKCKARAVVGGGKAAKRKGHTYAKYHCFKCGLSDWLAAPPNKACEANMAKRIARRLEASGK